MRPTNVTFQGDDHLFSFLKNYTANNISTIKPSTGIFSAELINQLHELAHSIEGIEGISDGTHSLTEDIGEAFSSCVQKQYNTLNKPKKKKKRVRRRG